MKKRIAIIALSILSPFVIMSDAMAQRTITGTVLDENKQPVFGATVVEKGTINGTVVYDDGHFNIIIPNETIVLRFSVLGFENQEIVVGPDTREVNVILKEENINLEEIAIYSQARKNTESTINRQVKESMVVLSGVSYQQIQKSQDKNASEVVRRIPGISIIDGKFVMVRGLSQRYNNVWINGGSVPSTEADSRAFSFDIIPSSQLDNLFVVKSPSPEYPADFSGGFVVLNTKDAPEKNSFAIDLGTSFNTMTNTNPVLMNDCKSDFGIKSSNTDLLTNGMTNDWSVKESSPLLSQSAGISGNYTWDLGRRKLLALGSFSYGSGYSSFLDMENSLFGAYDIANSKSNYLRMASDNQYNRNRKIGAMLNICFDSGNGKNKLEFKNIFNQVDKLRYTERNETNAQNDVCQSAEYYRQNRSIYNAQLTGRHKTSDISQIDWSLGYAYAGREIPDRRRYLLSDRLETGIIQLTSGNDISREFTDLDENIFSANLNYKRELTIWRKTLRIKAGAFAEHRSREYFTRYFFYNWNPSSNILSAGFRQMLASDLLSPQNCGPDKLYLQEEVKWRNNYEGGSNSAASYAGVSLPFGDKLSVYAGMRYEYSNTSLTANTRDYEHSPAKRNYTYSDIFPSVNSTIRVSDNQQMRLGYGKSVNRPEFREISTSVFYDFDLASDVQGNTDLKACYIQNFDLRYEIYPSRSELISFGIFYKHFDSPIEWTYTVAGGTNLVYSFVNADKSRSYGLEFDFKKDLDFMGLRDFSINANFSLIDSEVEFDAQSRDKDRPMQGQSPYLINAGLFYQPTAHNSRLLNSLKIGLLYNRIGKRLIGVGRSVGITDGEDTAVIPDSYEMPRDMVDLSIALSPIPRLKIQLGLRDMLVQDVVFEQFASVNLPDNISKKVREVTKRYSPGQTISLSVSYTFNK